jgi:hypothetical protein
MSLFHFHKWEVAESKPITSTAYGYFSFGVFISFDNPVSRPETHVLYRCKCGKVKAETIKGHWDKEVLAGASK